MSASYNEQLHEPQYATGSGTNEYTQGANEVPATRTATNESALGSGTGVAGNGVEGAHSIPNSMGLKEAKTYHHQLVSCYSSAMVWHSSTLNRQLVREREQSNAGCLHVGC